MLSFEEKLDAFEQVEPSSKGSARFSKGLLRKKFLEAGAFQGESARELQAGDRLPVQRKNSDSLSDGVDSSAESPLDSPTGEVAIGYMDTTHQLMADVFTLTSFDDHLAKSGFDVKRNFLMEPLPEGTCMYTRVIREKGGGVTSPLKRKRFLFYTEDGMLLVSGKKGGPMPCISSEYILSMDKSDFAKDSANYIGKLRVNHGGSECIAYDCGETPKTGVFSPKKNIRPENMREEMASIRYSGSSKEPRRIHVVLPADNADLDGTTLVPREGLMTFSERNIASPEGVVLLADLMGEERPKVIQEFTNKEPTIGVNGHYVLDFGDRVKKPCVKNFQLVKQFDDDESVYLQFGRISENEFSLDFAHPWSPFQALCVALSSIDYKI